MSRMSSTPVLAAACLVAGAAVDRLFLTDAAMPPASSPVPEAINTEPETRHDHCELPDLSEVGFSNSLVSREQVVPEAEVSEPEVAPPLQVDPCTIDSQRAALDAIQKALALSECPEFREEFRLAVLEMVSDESYMPSEIQEARQNARTRLGLFVGKVDAIAMDAIANLTPVSVKPINDQSQAGTNSIAYNVVTPEDGGSAQLVVRVHSPYGFELSYVLPDEKAQQIAAIQSLAYFMDGEPLEAQQVWTQFFEAPPIDPAVTK